jgi:hypothetical protein
MKTHTTKDGEKINLCDMTDRHLHATIQLLERKAKEGVTIVLCGGNPVDKDCHYDEETIYGDKALKRLGYAKYVNERDNRAKH